MLLIARHGTGCVGLLTLPFIMCTIAYVPRLNIAKPFGVKLSQHPIKFNDVIKLFYFTVYVHLKQISKFCACSISLNFFCGREDQLLRTLIPSKKKLFSLKFL